MSPKKSLLDLLNDDRVLLAEMKEKNMPNQATNILEQRIKTREYFLYGINMADAINFIFDKKKLNEMHYDKGIISEIESGKLIWDGDYLMNADLYYSYHWCDEHSPGPGYSLDDMIHEAVHFHGELDSKWFEWYYNGTDTEADEIPFDDMNDAIIEMLNVNDIIAYKSKYGYNSLVAIHKNLNLEYEYEVY
jgi:hypothetical protein